MVSPNGLIEIFAINCKRKRFADVSIFENFHASIHLLQLQVVQADLAILRVLRGRTQSDKLVSRE